jgi:hypothetical protein
MDAHPPEQLRDDPVVLRVSRPVRAALWVCWAISTLIGLVKVGAALGSDPNRPMIFDFHAFIIAGRLTWAGRLADAYNSVIMAGLQQQMGGHKLFMPWNYPPLFGLVMAPFSRLPIVPAYGLFALGAFALFVVALRRLAPAWAWLVLLTLAPCTIINLASGQNGFLTGGLFALAAAAFSRRQAGQGGLAIGALAYKPHMAVIWPVLLAARRRWATAAIAGAVALILTGLSFLAVGPAPFKAMIAAGAEASHTMAAGHYPLHRMTSLYTTGLSLGLTAAAALVLHAAGALIVLAGVVWAGRRLPEPALAGLAIMSTAFLSPYFYDYDLPLFGVGLAMVLPELAARSTRLRLGLLLGMVAAAQLIGLAVINWGFRPSLGGPLLMAAFGVMLQTLAQSPAGQEGATPVAGPVAARTA